MPTNNTLHLVTSLQWGNKKTGSQGVDSLTAGNLIAHNQQDLDNVPTIEPDMPVLKPLGSPSVGPMVGPLEPSLAPPL